MVCGCSTQGVVPQGGLHWEILCCTLQFAINSVCGPWINWLGLLQPLLYMNSFRDLQDLSCRTSQFLNNNCLINYVIYTILPIMIWKFGKLLCLEQKNIHPEYRKDFKVLKYLKCSWLFSWCIWYMIYLNWIYYYKLKVYINICLYTSS